MSSQYQPLTFNSNGKKYSFIVTMSGITAKTSIILDSNAIVSFEYVNEINKYCITGTLIYVDNSGVIDKFIDDQGVYCNIILSQYIEVTEGNIKILKPSDKPDENFNHRFIVNNIELIQRKNTAITYKLHLVSINWFICSNIISYSTYKNSPKTIFEILKECITDGTNNKLNIYKNFENIETNVKIDYITNGNDNLFTITKFLLNKLYYYTETDKSIKFIVYDEFDDNIRACDIKDSKTKKGAYPILLSFFNTSLETFQNSSGVQLGTVIKTPKTDTYQNTMFSNTIYSYSYEHNKINNLNMDKNLMSLEHKLSFYNELQAQNKGFEKFFNVNQMELFNQYLKNNNKSTTYWNDTNLNIYDNIITSLLCDNALIVNTSGELNRIPGDYVTISTDKTESILNEYPDVKDSYEYFNGCWIVGKIRHIIEPSKGKFTQNLILFKNFKNKK